jgi:hypothetical protein
VALDRISRLSSNTLDQFLQPGAWKLYYTMTAIADQIVPVCARARIALAVMIAVYAPHQAQLSQQV